MELSTNPLAMKSARAVAMDYKVSQDSPADVIADWYSAYLATIAALQPQLRYIQVRGVRAVGGALWAVRRAGLPGASVGRAPLMLRRACFACRRGPTASTSELRP